MKYIIICLLVISVNCEAQNNPKIKGIGDFIIGKTTVSSLYNITGLNIDTINYQNYALYDHDFKQNSFNKLYEVVEYGELELQDKYAMSIFDKKYFVPNYRLFKLRSYKIADLDITGIELIFYKDTLIKFKSETSNELINAIKLKYGEPKTKVDRNIITCTYTNTGAQRELAEEHILFTWANPPYKAENLVYNFYTSKCKELFVTYFLIEHIKKVEAFEETARQKLIMMDNVKKEKEALKYEKL